MGHSVALVLLLALIVGQIGRTTAQSCAPLTDPTCSQFIPVGTEVFVPSWATITALETLANRAIGIITFSPRISDPCYSAGLQMTCYTFIRPCQKIGNVSVPIPQQPCTHACKALGHFDDAACSPYYPVWHIPAGAGLYFPPGTAPPLNCSDPPLDVDAGNTPFYRANFSMFTYQGANYSLPCSNPVLEPPPAKVYCGAPLITVDNQGHATCAFACPLPSLTESQYDSVKIMQGIVGWMSWVGSAFLIFSMILDPGARTFPRNLITMVACAANVAAGAIILPTMAGYANTWCGGSDQYLTPTLSLISVDSSTGFVDIGFSIAEEDLSFSSSLCTFQGAVLQFGFLSAVFWWVIIAFNMCLELFLGKRLPLEKRWWKWSRFGVYNLLAWGAAFLLMVIPASAGSIKFASAGTYCFVSTEDNSAWILTFWFIPVGISLLAGVTLFICALVRLTILLVTIKKVKELLLLHLRLFIFIFLYLFLFVLIFSYNIQIEKDKGDIQTGYEAYFKCIIYAQDDCSLSDSVSNYDLVMLKGWAISSLGVLLFITFLPGPIMKFWYSFFKAVVVACYTRSLDDLNMVFRVVMSGRTSTLSVRSEHSLSLAEAGTEDAEEEEDADEQTGADEEEEQEEHSSSSATN